MKRRYGTLLLPAVIASFVASWLVIAVPAGANNIQVENVSLTGQNVISNYIYIQFDISWDNSWKLTKAAPFNWDAAWVFAKWKLKSGGAWNHCILSTTGTDHTAPSGSEIDASFTRDDNGKGIFIYRDTSGTGSNDWNKVNLRWNYASGMPQMGDDDLVEIKVFAVEMVLVPLGAFYLGDGTSTNTFYNSDSPTNPALISTTSVNVTAAGEMTGGPIAVDGFFGITGNTLFPTGYTAFYCMKYELSQGQYADFLNTLTSVQDANRFQDEDGNFRHTIAGTAGSRTASRPDRACNYLSWKDGKAYADWAGLRPMTELEFEKACRGPQSPVAGEYAWGTATIVPDSSLTLSGTEDGTETVTTDVSAGAAVYGDNHHSGGDAGRGPLRCGIFATAASNRVSAGASYYGVMEMSGNLVERPVTLGTSSCRSFTGTHGDGALDPSGDADAPNWPYYTGLRDGCYLWIPDHIRVSNRHAAAGDYGDRSMCQGFRAVRTP